MLARVGQGCAPEDHRVSPGVDREAVLVVVHEEGTRFGIEGQSYFSAFEGGAVVVTQYREQDLPVQLLLACGKPVDVEEGSVRRGSAALQHVVPQGVVAADAHMVGNDVEKLAHIVVPERLHHLPVVSFAPEFRVERSGVYDVVAVRATWPGFQVG